MLTISGVLFLGGFLLQRRQRSSVSLFVVHFTAVVMVAYLLCLWESPLLVQVLPFSAAIILGNWLPLFGALYAGVCVGASQIPQYRRFVFSASLLLLGAFSLIRPLTGVAPDCLDSPSTRGYWLRQRDPHVRRPVRPACCGCTGSRSLRVRWQSCVSLGRALTGLAYIVG